MRTPRRWALSLRDQHSHLLAERGTGNSPDSGRPPVEQFPRPIPAPSGRPDPRHQAGGSSVGPVSADAAARALQECFLANADRGDDAANDELVAELVRRIRALQACREGGC